MKYAKKKKKNRIIESFFSIFHLIAILKKNNSNIKFQIVTLNFSTTHQGNLIKWKKIVELAKKYKINLDFYNAYKKNNQTFHYGAYKTKGMYCKPKLKINETLIQKKFLNSFITLFILPILKRQFLLLPLPTKSVNKFYSNGLIKKTQYICPNCFSVLILPNCFTCGNEMYIQK